MFNDIELSNDEKKLVNSILDIEDTIFCHFEKLSIKQKNTLLARKEAKELTMSILSLDNNYTKEDLCNIEKYWDNQIKKRINIIIAQNFNKRTHPSNYAGKSWIHHLVEHNDIKLIKLHLFKEKIQDLSLIKEDLLSIAIKNKNPSIIELLIHYQHPVNEDNVFNLKKILEETNYHFNDKVKNKINVLEEQFLLKLELAIEKKLNKMEF